LLSKKLIYKEHDQRKLGRFLFYEPESKTVLKFTFQRIISSKYEIKKDKISILSLIYDHILLN